MCNLLSVAFLIKPVFGYRFFLITVVSFMHFSFQLVRKLNESVIVYREAV